VGQFDDSVLALWTVMCVAPYRRCECLSAAGTRGCRVSLPEVLTAVPMT